MSILPRPPFLPLRLWNRLKAQEISGQFSFSLIPALMAVEWMVFRLADGYFIQSGVEPILWLQLSALLLIPQIGSWLFSASAKSGTWTLLRVLLANTAGVALLPWTFSPLGIPLGFGHFAILLTICSPLQWLLCRAHAQARSTAPLEPLRYALIAAVGLIVASPFLTSKTVGTGDAVWYGNMVSDFLVQWRAGIFPALVGQSDYAFNGAISPLRYAPYLQHAAGVLDLLTLRLLSPVALLNVLLTLSLMGGAVSAYACLSYTRPQARWLAWLLAILFILTPAILALAYTGDLFMSVCTLPFLPVIYLGLVRSLETRSSPAVYLVATALAATWLCHPPIAFWMGAIAGLAQACRLVHERREPTLWRTWAGAALLFAVLVSGSFISVFALRIPNLVADRFILINNLRDVFPASLLPVSEGAAALSDYQLGWAMWAILLSGFILTLVKRQRAAIALASGAVLLGLLIFPVPGLNFALWKAMPQAVVDITFFWAVQRLYPVLAVLIVFLALIAGTEFFTSRRWLHGMALVLLGLGVNWASQDAQLFVERGVRNVAPEALWTLGAHPQNRLLTRYAYSPFPTYPNYFSHGYIDPTWENRILEDGSWKELDSNYRSILSQPDNLRLEGQLGFRAESAQNTYFALLSDLPISARRHYALEVELAHSQVKGSLALHGKTVAREYYVPDSGIGLPRASAPTSFGTLPTSHRAFPVTGTFEPGEKLSLEFISETPIERDLTPFGTYRLREYQPDQLPVVVENWTPYRARVNASAAGWLETPRMFVPGYHATIDGRSIGVRRSPGGLVMLPVPAGRSNVTLSYPGTVQLQLAYWGSIAAWLVVLIGWTQRFWHLRSLT